MRFYPPDFNIMAIDPGANMGITIATISMTDQIMWVVDSFTLVIDDCIGLSYSARNDTYTKRQQVQAYLERRLTQLMNRYDVEHVIYEAAYNRRSLVAYDSLVFYGNTISNICHHYDFDVSYESVAPSRVKTNIGVTGNSGDKGAVRQAVRRHPHIQLPPELLLDDLTEHAVDSIAIAYVAYTQCIKELNARNRL